MLPAVVAGELLMKILVLADVESKYLWDYFEKEKLEGIDLILSAGDLKPQYLSFLSCIIFKSTYSLCAWQS